MPGVARTLTRFERESAAAGLIAGTVPTKGTSKRERRCGSTTSTVEAVLQATATRSGAWRSIRRSMTRATRSASACSLNRPYGKAGVVRGIDEARVGARLQSLGEDREAAEPRIEDENGRHGG